MSSKIDHNFFLFFLKIMSISFRFLYKYYFDIYWVEKKKLEFEVKLKK